jgi:hypothetical protein
MAFCKRGQRGSLVEPAHHHADRLIKAGEDEPRQTTKEKELLPLVVLISDHRLSLSDSSKAKGSQACSSLGLFRASLSSLIAKSFKQLSLFSQATRQ